MGNHYYSNSVNGYYKRESNEMSVQITKIAGKYYAFLSNGKKSKGYDSYKDAAEWAEGMKYGAKADVD